MIQISFIFVNNRRSDGLENKNMRIEFQKDKLKSMRQYVSFFGKYLNSTYFCRVKVNILHTWNKYEKGGSINSLSKIDRS